MVLDSSSSSLKASSSTPCASSETATVVAALEAQVWAAIRELVQWTDGEFAFNREEDGYRTEGRVAVALDPQAVLLDVFRERDEAQRGTAQDTVH